MKNKSLAFALIALVVIGVIVLVTTRKKTQTVIQSHHTYSIKSDSNRKTYTVSTPSEYSFSIVDEQGNTLKDFAITHTKPMHVIVVRKDLAYFQHVHPAYNQATGKFSFKDLSFPADGEYRIFADFAPNSSQKDSMGTPLPVTISEDVPVGSGASYTHVPLGSEEKTKTFDGIQVSLLTRDTPVSGGENMLMFRLSENGKPVTDLEPYLGALGHAVILHEGNLDFIHAHPMGDMTMQQNGTVNFMVDFPLTGKYKVFTQFQKGGKVITTDFVVSVVEASSDSIQMNHSMH